MIIAMSMTFTNCTTNVYAAHHGNWIQIGEKSVDMHGDHDVMYINGWRDTFTKLKLKVVKSPIYVRNVKIVYGNGQVQNIKINKRFHAGEESQALDLPGYYREVEKIIFNYDTINVGNGRAVVKAFARI